MPPKTPAPSDNKAKGKSAVADPKAKAANGKVLPEEQFWQRYSPHHEFPLSSTASVALHILVLAFLSVAAWAALYFFGDDTKPPDVSAVVVDSGGGGSKNGVENGPGSGAVKEDTGPTQPDKPPQPDDIKDVNVKEPDPIKLEVNDDKGRPLNVTASEAIKNLSKVDEDARKKLWNSMAGDKGKGGSGKGGGYGSGVGTGTGSGAGSGNKAMSQRQKRAVRWVMHFKVYDGTEYLRQLRDLKPGTGAILAVPAGHGQFEVIRDLSKKPAKGKIEELESLNRIFWMSDDPTSVAGLAQALGIPTPPYFAAFLPPELEDELARQEREKSGGAREDDIERTDFDVVRSQDGYRAQVLSVTRRR